jgi:hypothetical protein
MDSDDSNISDHVGDLDIQPYQFEPLCNDENQQERIFTPFIGEPYRVLCM